jgi:hypothetical protein
MNIPSAWIPSFRASVDWTSIWIRYFLASHFIEKKEGENAVQIQKKLRGGQWHFPVFALALEVHTQVTLP